MAGADLHLHSTSSDGVDSPSEVCRRAVEAGLDAIALTDHDSVGGVAEALGAGERLRLQVIPGCEFTAYIGSEELHVLGYGMDYNDERLLQHLEDFRTGRRKRAELIVERLAEAGAPVSLDRVWELAGKEGAVGRVHLAQALLEAGHVQNFNEAFRRFIGAGCPCHVPKIEISPLRVIELIHAAGGAAVLAHPGINNQEPLIPDLIAHGLDGVEVWHSLHTHDQSDNLFALAKRYGILVTGGSDCHGALAGRPPILGTVRIDRNQVQALLIVIERRRQAVA